MRHLNHSSVQCIDWLEEHREMLTAEEVEALDDADSIARVALRAASRRDLHSARPPMPVYGPRLQHFPARAPSKTELATRIAFLMRIPPPRLARRKLHEDDDDDARHRLES